MKKSEVCVILNHKIFFGGETVVADTRFEYIVKKNTALLKFYLILAYILFPVAATVLVVNLFHGTILVFPGIIAGLGVDVLLIFFTWRFTRVEIECSIDLSALTVTTIHGGSHRKIELELDIKSFYEVGLFTPEASDHLERSTLHKDYVFISSLDSENIYYAVFSEGEDRCVLYFETTPEAFAHIKKLNFSAVKRAEIQQKRETEQ